MNQIADNQTSISFQDAVTTSEITKFTTIQQMCYDIRDGEYKNLIENLRSLPRSDARYKELKENLPAYIITGTYKSRQDNLLIESSGYAVVDIDKIPDKLDNYKVILTNDPYTYALFLSPSGDGLKLIYKMPKVSGKDEFVNRAKTYTQYLVELGIPRRDKNTISGIDTSASEVLSQACFVSYDPDIFTNEESEIWEGNITKQDVAKSPSKSGESSYIKEIEAILAPYLDNKMHHNDLWSAVSEIIKANIPIIETQDFFKKYNTILFAEDSTDYGAFSKVEKDITAIYKKHNIKARKYDEDGNLNGYIRAGTSYFREVVSYDDKGYVLVPHTRQAIIDDFGRDALNKVKKYNGFTVVPDNFNRLRQKGGYFNLYENIAHKPSQGDWSHIKKMINHIFGKDQYEYGLDYIQLLLFNPKQRSPFFCLVSSESNTGKSTFAQWMVKLLSPNAVEIKAGILKRDFNTEYITKRVIVVDEAGFLSNEIQDLKSQATSDMQHYHAKGKDAYRIPFYGSFILCSNDETNFITITQTEDRFWVRKIPRIQKSDIDPLFAEKIEKEIPALIYFLKRRTMKVTLKQGRFWFNMNTLNTEALNDVRQASKPNWVQCIEDRIQDYFIQEDAEKEVNLTLSDIMDFFIPHQRTSPKSTTVKNHLKHDPRFKSFPQGTDPKYYSRHWLEKVFPTTSFVPNSKTGRYYTLQKQDWK